MILARLQILDEKKRQEWIDNQCQKLLEDQVEKVISEIRACRPINEHAAEAKKKALSYYMDHEDRMQYKTYKEQGLLIGSGPIEAAHRSVLQQRMKLSGQFWSIPGAQAIANLRCYQKSGAWDMVKKVIATAA